MRRLRWVPALMVALALLLLAGCSSPGPTGTQPPATPTAAVAPTAPGTGVSIADKVFRAAGLKMGEVLVYMAKEGTEPRSATTRVMRAANSNPAWASTDEFTNRANSQVVTYTFKDGSTLVLRGQGRLEAVEVTRP